MYIRKFASVCTFTLFLISSVCAQPTAGHAIQSISQMTLEEKISILVNQSDKYNINFADATCGLALYAANTYKKAPQTFNATSFPVPSMLACSWNKDLLYQIGVAIGKEAASQRQVDVLYLPALNPIRNPLCGNNWAFFSDDPNLVAQMATSLLKGVHSQKVPFVVRYYGLYDSENQKNDINLLIDQRTLREFYLRPFEKVCKDIPIWGVLTSNSQINGEFVAESSTLIQALLQEEWKYAGLLLSDCYPDTNNNSISKLQSDFVLHCDNNQKQSFYRSIEEGRMTEENVDAHLKRYLTAYQQLSSPASQLSVNKSEHHQLSKEAAAESVVLLKNIDESLPIAAPIKRVAFYGVSSYRFIQSPNMRNNHGDYNIMPMQHPSLVQLFMKSGYTCDPALINLYLKYLKGYLPEEAKPAASPKVSAPSNTSSKTAPQQAAKPTTPANRPKPLSGEELMKQDLMKVSSISPKTIVNEMEVSKSLAQQYSKTSQMGIVVVGHANQDENGRRHYQLSETECNMIKNVCAAYHAWGKKVIVILNVDGPVDFAEWSEYPDAILYCGLAGEGAPEALFDILTGKTTPSGKLNMVYAKSMEKYPSSHQYLTTGDKTVRTKGDDETEEIVFSERFRVGYRYFDEHQEQVLYPFGYGLSYTTFNYDQMKVQRKGDSVLVSVRITNTGKYAGKEVVQLYVSPQRKHLIMEKALKEMKDFAKTRLLKAGESQVLTMRFSEYDLAAFDEKSNHWITSAGNYTVKLGASSQDIKLQYPFQIVENIIY